MAAVQNLYMNWIALEIFFFFVIVHNPLSQSSQLFFLVDPSSKKLPRVEFYFSFKIVALLHFPTKLVAFSNLKRITLFCRA